MENTILLLFGFVGIVIGLVILYYVNWLND